MWNISFIFIPNYSNKTLGLFSQSMQTKSYILLTANKANKQIELKPHVFQFENVTTTRIQIPHTSNSLLELARAV